MKFMPTVNDCSLHAPSKAAGLNRLVPQLLKDSAYVIAKPMTILINISLTNGRVPLEWKSACVMF